MSKHEYKFGDRCQFRWIEEDPWRRGIVKKVRGYTDANGERQQQCFVIGDDGSSGSVSSDGMIAPGWPDPPDHVRVRAAVTIESTGDWNCYGGMGVDDAEMRDEASGYGVEIGDASAVHFIEAMVPLPKQETIEAEVVS